MGYDLGSVRALAQDAAERPAWSLFAEYCRLRGEGLRSEALKALDAFIAEAVVWPLAERVAFSVWVGEQRQAYRGQPEAVLPVPLFRLLVRPTLEAWAEASPGDPWPPLWLARLSSGGSTWHAPAAPFLAQALARDPDFAPARLDFVLEVMRGVSYSQHELPELYLGDAAQDLADLTMAEAFLRGMELERQFELRPRLVQARQAAARWIEGRG
ncbi:MAG: hypothetical protein J7521_05030 [Caulobacter sp.]|nr:hypothetical protein [Caulobacter sp.]